MIKFLIIGVLIFYALYKMGIFRAFITGYNEPLNRKRPHSNVNVNNMPPAEKKKSSFKGGEYVDYEEIK